MAVGYTRVNPERVFAFSTAVLEKMGVPHEEAEITSRLLVDTDFRGIESHGIAHLAPFYIKRMKDGLINPKPNIKTWSSSPATVVMDGDDGLGFVCGYRAMQEAIVRARTAGAGFVSVRNSTHYGACSAYSLLAVKEGMLGFSCTTGGRGAVAPGGSGREIGINAMSFAAPSGKDFPFCLDMSTTIVAHGKIEIAQRLKKNVPAGWQVDPDGFPITNPQEELERRGAMVLLGQTPEMGVYKGFGLNIMLEILSSVLSESPTIVEIGGQPRSQGKCTHFCGAIKIAGFMEMGDYVRGMENMYAVYHNVPKAKGVPNITLAGEPEWAIEQDRRQNGIPYDDEVIAGLKGLSKEFGVTYDL
jgi:L-2-hydroxycarboxylate dehydrogenase (NAD+)